MTQIAKQLKIGITGGRTYENRLKIKNFLHKLKEQTDNAIVIVSLGDSNGADKYVKKFALEFGYTYEECNPEYTNKNLYSILSEAHYGKPYTARSVHVRDKIFCMYIDKCIVFDNSNMADIKIINLVKLFTRRKKPLIVIS